MAETILGDLGSFVRGQGGTKADERPAGLPCLRYGELYTEHDVRVHRFVSFIDLRAESRYTPLRSGDIVFAASGETHKEIGKGAVFIGDTRAVAGADTIIFTPKPGNDPVFLSYAANSECAARFKAQQGQGSSVIHISTRHLHELPLWLPTLPEQRQIAEVLDTVDEAARKTEQIIAKLKQVKQGLLHDLLTRGIDDNGELRDPDRHPEQFKDSPLGRIPKRWATERVESLLAPVNPSMRSGPFGSALLKHELVDAGVPLLGIDNVHVERFVAKFSRFVAPNKAAELSRYRVRPKDVMITIMGTVGRCCIVPDDLGEALSSKHVWTLTFDQDRYSPLLACLQFNHAPWILRHFANNEQGGIMSAIRSETLRAAVLPVPPIPEAKEVENVLAKHTERIEHEADAVAKLRLLKNGLMEDLLTGRVRVTPLLPTPKTPADAARRT